MKENALFPTDRRIHLGLGVRDLEGSIRFYEVLFGEPPVKRREGYAKFEPADPSVNLSLNRVPAMGAPRSSAEHFGIQVHGPDVVRAAGERLRKAGLSIDIEEATACCYAVQEKVWATDPEGRQWEIFAVLGESDQRSSKTSDCCGDDAESRTECCAEEREESGAGSSECCPG